MYAFIECTNLSSVYITDLAAWCNIQFSSYYDTPLQYAHHLFLNEEEIKELNIPDGVNSIGPYAFYLCSEITSIIIPSSVNTILNSAFYGLSSLTDVYCYAETPPTINSNEFYGSYIAYNGTLHVPPTSLLAYKSALPWATFKNIVPIEEGNPLPVNERCATPTIEYSNGNVTCNCETAGVKYVYEIAPVTVKRESDTGKFAFSPTYEIKVYATREDLKDSEPASIIVALQNVGDVNGDGQVSIADVTSLVNAILGK